MDNIELTKLGIGLLGILFMFLLAWGFGAWNSYKIRKEHNENKEDWSADEILKREG